MVVVEDSQTDVFLVRASLEAHRLDVELEIIPDGEKAIAFLHSLEYGGECPSLMLLDLNLPRIGGLEVLSQVRANKRCGDIPVIIMTSSDAEKDRRESAALRATGYFRKPSGYEAFLKLGEVIRGILDAGSAN